MHTRLFYGTIQSGKEQEALQVLNEFVDHVKQLRGCLLAQRPPPWLDTTARVKGSLTMRCMN